MSTNDCATLMFEGDTDAVLSALVTEEPGFFQVNPGGGIAGAQSAGLAPALEVHRLRQQTPFVGFGVSVGVANLALHIYRIGLLRARCYVDDFCSPRFIQPGVMPWFWGTKCSIDYYGAVLRHRLRDQRAHPDSVLQIGLTHFETGAPHVFTVDLANTARVAQLARASAQLPCFGKGHVLVDGEAYCDGAMSESLSLATLRHSQARYILIVMANPQSAMAYDPGLAAQKFVLAQLYMWNMPVAIRDAWLQQEIRFAAEVTALREQLARPLGDPARWLPPTCIVWPRSSCNFVEQCPQTITRVLGQSYAAWLQVLQQYKSRIAAAAAS